MTAVPTKLTRKTKGGAYGSGVYGSGVYGFSFIINEHQQYHFKQKLISST